MQKKKTLSCSQDNVFLMVFQWPHFKVGTFHAFTMFSCSVFAKSRPKQQNRLQLAAISQTVQRLRKLRNNLANFCNLFVKEFL